MASLKDLITGLQIMVKYAEDGEDTHIGGADHDIIYGALDGSAEISTEDIVALEEAGWHYEEDTECWSRFV